MDFGNDILDIGALLEKEEAILESDTPPDDGEWEFIQRMKELRDEFWLPLEDIEEPTLILDSYFEDYAQEFADGIGAIDANAQWPINHIDWEGAADDLKMDYSSIQVGQYEYWHRG